MLQMAIGHPVSRHRYRRIIAPIRYDAEAGQPEKIEIGVIDIVHVSQKACIPMMTQSTSSRAWLLSQKPTLFGRRHDVQGSCHPIRSWDSYWIFSMRSMRALSLSQSSTRCLRCQLCFWRQNFPSISTCTRSSDMFSDEMSAWQSRRSCWLPCSVYSRKREMALPVV